MSRRDRVGALMEQFVDVYRRRIATVVLTPRHVVSVTRDQGGSDSEVIAALIDAMDRVQAVERDLADFGFDALAIALHSPASAASEKRSQLARQRKVLAHHMRASGKSLVEIADALQVDQRTASRYFQDNPTKRH